jgi:hypothetical protein
MEKKRKQSLVRSAWGLSHDGGLVVVPDEFNEVAHRLELSPTERLTVFALLRAWNPRTSPVPIVRVSLVEMRKWTGLSQGHQSGVVKELLECFDPPVFVEAFPARRGEPRGLSLTVFLRLAAGGEFGTRRVRPAERNGGAMGSAGRTVSFGQPNANDALGSAAEPASPPPRLSTEKEEAEVAALDDEKLRDRVLRGCPFAQAEWAERKKRKRRSKP